MNSKSILRTLYTIWYSVLIRIPYEDHRVHFNYDILEEHYNNLLNIKSDAAQCTAVACFEFTVKTGVLNIKQDGNIYEVSFDSRVHSEHQNLKQQNISVTYSSSKNISENLIYLKLLYCSDRK